MKLLVVSGAFLVVLSFITAGLVPTDTGLAKVRLVRDAEAKHLCGGQLMENCTVDDSDTCPGPTSGGCAGVACVTVTYDPPSWAPWMDPFVRDECQTTGGISYSGASYAKTKGGISGTNGSTDLSQIHCGVSENCGIDCQARRLGGPTECFASSTQNVAPRTPDVASGFTCPSEPF